MVNSLGIEKLIYPQDQISTFQEDNCLCERFDTHTCAQNSDRWNPNFCLKNQKLKQFLELLAQKINSDYQNRNLLEENLSKYRETLMKDYQTDQRLKLLNRIPKQHNNISMISSVKSDFLGKEISNDIREDSILREIPC